MQTLSKRQIEKLEQNAIPDEQLDFSDDPDTDEEFWTNAEWESPHSKKKISIYIDEDVFRWLKQYTTTYQTFINSMLRNYMEEKKQEPDTHS